MTVTVTPLSLKSEAGNWGTFNPDKTFIKMETVVR